MARDFAAGSTITTSARARPPPAPRTRKWPRQRHRHDQQEHPHPRRRTGRAVDPRLAGQVRADAARDVECVLQRACQCLPLTGERRDELQASVGTECDAVGLSQQLVSGGVDCVMRPLRSSSSAAFGISSRTAESCRAVGAGAEQLRGLECAAEVRSKLIQQVNPLMHAVGGALRQAKPKPPTLPSTASALWLISRMSACPHGASTSA